VNYWIQPYNSSSKSSILTWFLPFCDCSHDFDLIFVILRKIWNCILSSKMYNGSTILLFVQKQCFRLLNCCVLIVSCMQLMCTMSLFTYLELLFFTRKSITVIGRVRLPRFHINWQQHVFVTWRGSFQKRSYWDSSPVFLDMPENTAYDVRLRGAI
jgi:hypothetical protein